MNTITDLDELALRIRTDESRVLFVEALHAYRAGAFRSAVTSTWIAVVYDAISKIRELSIGGDKPVEQFIAELDEAIANQNRVKLQLVEAEIIRTAREKFELLSELKPKTSNACGRIATAAPTQPSLPITSSSNRRPS